MIKRVTIVLIIIFWFLFGLLNVLDLRLGGLFYLPIIGILPFISIIAWGGWVLARHGSQRILLANALVFSFFGSLPFFLVGMQDQSVWRFAEQAIVLTQDFILFFTLSFLVGEIRIKVFKTSLLPWPPDSNNAIK